MRVELTALFSNLRQDAQDEARLANRLSSLLNQLKGCSFATRKLARLPSPFTRNDTATLSLLLGNLQQPMVAIETAGLFGNPWTAAALGRNEIRNAGVLAWFLNPRGGHGCGNAILVDLLAQIRGQLIDFPTEPSSCCRVSVEECPDGIAASRVDIQIDDPGRFFLIIEVKIDANEQPEQIKRYCDIAGARTVQSRPWAVVFLTPHGKHSVTAGSHVGRVIPLAWSIVARCLRRVTRPSPAVDGAIPSFLAKAFADHVSKF